MNTEIGKKRSKNYLCSLIDSLISQEDVYELQKWSYTSQMVFNVKKCKLLRITYRKSTVIKYEYNIYQVNALSDNTSPAMTLLADNTKAFQ